MRRRFLVVVVLLVTLALSAIAYQHSHDRGAARSCDVCQVGHTPALQTSGPLSVRAPQPVEWHAPSEQAHPDLEPLLTSSPSRAPPA